MLRKLTAVFLFVALAAALCLPAAAYSENQAETQVIAPRYTCFAGVYPTLSISGGTATVAGRITGLATTTKLSYTVKLQVKSGSSWSDVSTWSGAENGVRATYSYTKSVTAGKTYRNQTTVTATAGGKSETVTVYSAEKVG